MKKQFLVLLAFFLFSSSQLLPIGPELKIYRKKESKAAIIGTSAGIALSAAAGVLITWGYHSSLKPLKPTEWQQKTEDRQALEILLAFTNPISLLSLVRHTINEGIDTTERIKRTLGYLAGPAISALLIIPTTIALVSLIHDYRKWNSKLNKPFIIFDEEGFTCEMIQAESEEPKDMRFYWKDVITRWDENITNAFGTIVEKKWCYRVVDHATKKHLILRIDAMRLDIPQEIEARVEAVHQGKVEAFSA